MVTAILPEASREPSGLVRGALPTCLSDHKITFVLIFTRFMERERRAEIAKSSGLEGKQIGAM